MENLKPINISPVTRVFLAALPQINTALANNKVSVVEAIDIVASLAKSTAQEMGVADNPVIVTDSYKPDA